MAIWEPFNSSSQRLMTSIVSANRISQTHTRLSFTLSIPWIYLVISLQRLFIQNNISKHTRTRTHNVTDTKLVSTQYFQFSTLLDEMGWDGMEWWTVEYESLCLVFSYHLLINRAVMNGVNAFTLLYAAASSWFFNGKLPSRRDSMEIGILTSLYRWDSFHVSVRCFFFFHFVNSLNFYVFQFVFTMRSMTQEISFLTKEKLPTKLNRIREELEKKEEK